MPPGRLARVLGAGAITIALAGAAVVVTRPPGHVRGAAPPPGTAAVPVMAAQPAVPLPTAPAAQPAPQPAAGGGIATATRLSNSWGIDVSWPQCDGLPTLAAGFVTVGVNDGRPFTANPCLDAEAAYAEHASGYAVYLNLDAPRAGDPASWGRRAALDALARAQAVGLRPPVLWLDVEVKNHWADPATNVAVIAAAVRALRRHGVTAGVYSSEPMWLRITGDAAPNMPVWLATPATAYSQIDGWCRLGLGGQPAVLAQYVATTGSQLIDVDVLCKNALPASVSDFAPGRS